MRDIARKARIEAERMKTRVQCRPGKQGRVTWFVYHRGKTFAQFYGHEGEAWADDLAGRLASGEAPRPRPGIELG